MARTIDRALEDAGDGFTSDGAVP